MEPPLRLGFASVAVVASIGTLAFAGGTPEPPPASFRPPSPMVRFVHPRVSVPARRTPCASSVAPAGSGELGVKGLAHAYDLNALYRAGDTGRQATIAVVEFSRFRPKDVEAFERCVGSHAKVSTEIVDGGPPPAHTTDALLGELEADVDVEELTGLAPSAHIVVVEGVENTAAEVLDTYATAINSGAQVVSTSWGSCEADITTNFASSEAALFQRAALLKETVVAASGDLGSADCYNGKSSSARLAVDDPASQPYVVAVGGTTFTDSGRQSVWNEGASGGAGGGGLSRHWAMPTYQSLLAPAAEAGAPPGLCPQGVSGCRAVPDVTADAGTPVLFYCSIRNLCSGWTIYGGTSVGAPLWAAIFALADASSACHGSPLGFVDPAIYSIAGGSAAARAFTPVRNGGNNLFGTRGDFSARPGYNLASGLGAPIAGNGHDGRLVAQLCSAPRPSPTAVPSLVAS